MPSVASIARWPSAVAPPWLPIAGTTNGSAPSSRSPLIVPRSSSTRAVSPRLPAPTATVMPRPTSSRSCRTTWWCVSASTSSTGGGWATPSSTSVSGGTVTAGSNGSVTPTRSWSQPISGAYVRELGGVGCVPGGLTDAVRPADQRFVGEICGFGTASGCRVVIGRWPQSPFGSFADAMVEQADGHRLLIAPSDELAAYVSGVYGFDETVVAPVSTERVTGRLRFVGGPLAAAVTIGGRDPLGWVLRGVPTALATSTRWAVAVDPIARLTMRGVRTRGSTVGGDEFYGATDRHHVTAVQASWDGVDLGPLTDVEPPVRFGFSSTPRRPSIVAVTTTVRPR